MNEMNVCILIHPFLRVQRIPASEYKLILMPVTANSGILRNTLGRNLGDDKVVLGPQRNNITLQYRNSSSSLELDNKVTTLPMKLNVDGNLYARFSIPPKLEH
jgi:hypothetical protein